MHRTVLVSPPGLAEDRVVLMHAYLSSRAESCRHRRLLRHSMSPWRCISHSELNLSLSEGSGDSRSLMAALGKGMSDPLTNTLGKGRRLLLHRKFSRLRDRSYP